MRETIVFAPGINGQEMIKSLAMHGKNCINLRICNAGELARIAFMRSGISINLVSRMYLNDNTVVVWLLKIRAFKSNNMY